MRRIYLDHNATTPLAPSVLEAMRPFLVEHFGDPVCDHGVGRIAAAALEEARERVAERLGGDVHEWVFTSGGTESNHLALMGCLMSDPRWPQTQVVISAVEHPAVIGPAQLAERLGARLTRVPVDRHGIVDLEKLAQLLRQPTRLVSIQHANHETGVIQPLRAIAEICHQQGTLLHSDAAQTVGKIPTRIDELGVDLLSLSAHKFYGPKGSGALFIRRGVPCEPQFHGQGEESGLRGGTANVAAIVGLAAAVDMTAKALDAAAERLSQLRERLWSGLQHGVGPELVLHGRDAERLPQTLCLSFPRVDARELLARIPELCAAVVDGSASLVAFATTQLSRSQTASPSETQQPHQAIRLSLGWGTSEDQIERTNQLLCDSWESLVS